MKKASEEKIEAAPIQEPQIIVTNGKEKTLQNTTKDYTGAVFLIAIGTLLVLNNFGVVPWSVWTTLWRFWPLLIIFGGINLLLGKGSIASKILLAFTSILVILIVIVVSIISAGGKVADWLIDRFDFIDPDNITFFTQGDKLSRTLSVGGDDYTGLDTRNISIDIGATQFWINDDAEQEESLKVDANYYEGYQEPQLSADVSNGVADIEFDTETQSRFYIGGLGGGKETDFTFTLGDDKTPTNLDMSVGAAEGTVNLSEVVIDDFNVKLGAGELNVTMKKNSLPSGSASLEVGAGEINLVIPKGVALKIDYSVGLGTIELDDETVVDFAGDSTYKSDGYNTAETKIDLEIKVGAGVVNITRE